MKGYRLLDEVMGSLARIGRPAVIGVLVVGSLVCALLIAHYPRDRHDPQSDPVADAESMSRPSASMRRVSPFLARRDPSDLPIVAPAELASDTPRAVEGSDVSGETLESPLPEVPLHELRALHAQQLSELATLWSNPLSLIELPPSDDLLASVTLDELNQLHAQQNMEARAGALDGGFLVLPDFDDGIAIVGLAELAELHRQQEWEYRNRDSAELFPVPDFGAGDEPVTVTTGWVSERARHESAAAQRFSADPGSLVVLPESSDPQHGITIGELNRLHRTQNTPYR